MWEDIWTYAVSFILIGIVGYGGFSICKQVKRFLGCDRICEDCITDFMIRYCRSLNASERTEPISLDILNRLASKMKVRCFACTILIHIEKDIKYDDEYSVVFFDKKTRYTSIQRLCCLHQHLPDKKVFVFVP